MAHSVLPSVTPADSTLACVACARAKARCDRKVPCSRCTMKNTNCQTRISKRGPGQFANKKHKAPPSTNTSENLDNVEARAADSTITDGPNSTRSQNYPTGNGIYMNWSHSVGEKWITRSTLQAEQMEDSLARFMGLGARANENCRPNIYSSSRPREVDMFGITDSSNFLQSRALSPTGQPPDLSVTPPWGLGFGPIQGVFEESENHYGNDLLNDCGTAPSSFAPTDSSLHSND